MLFAILLEVVLSSISPSFSTCPSTQGVQILNAWLSPDPPTIGEQLIALNTTVKASGLFPSIFKITLLSSYSMQIFPANIELGSINFYEFNSTLTTKSGLYTHGTYVYTIEIIDSYSLNILACLQYNVTIPNTVSNAGVPCNSDFYDFLLTNVNFNSSKEGCTAQVVDIRGVIGFSSTNGVNVSRIDVAQYFGQNMTLIGQQNFYFNQENITLGNYNNYSILIPQPQVCSKGNYFYVITLIDVIGKYTCACWNFSFEYSESRWISNLLQTLMIYQILL